ncbi:MAG: peptide chain release factor N(5)-glutamine methyltransferase [Oscillospiraceae bacterium]|nr:peptide chain release factor N(5)-glutamine methyltransferase [Oscillospiraceae bacterium]
MVNIENILREGGVENYKQEAAWIIKYSHNHEEIARRRITGEPLQYLLGEWEFYGYSFKVGEGVLIPRPETELLVDIAIHNAQFTMHNSLVYDLCAGSGCVGITLAKETGCSVVAVEKSEEAIHYLKQNAELNKVDITIIQDDVLNPVMQYEIADCVLINPPYLSKIEMTSLQKEVTHEPREALYGGEDGLDFYRKIYQLWGNKARFFATEIGDGQAERVMRFMPENSVIVKDFNNIERVIYSIKE